MTAAPRQVSAIVLATVLGASMFGGTASAYWRTTGTGSGTAVTGSMTVTVDAVPAPATTATAGTLIPGGTASAYVRLTNSAESAVVVTGITADSGSKVVGTCPAGSVTFTPPQTFPAASFTLAKGESKTLPLADALRMSDTAAQGCMGQTFAIPVTVTVQTA